MSEKYFFDKYEKIFIHLNDEYLPSYTIGLTEVSQQVYETYYNVAGLIDYIDGNNVYFFDLPHSIKPYDIKLVNFNKTITKIDDSQYVYSDAVPGEILKFNLELHTGDKYNVVLSGSKYNLSYVDLGEIIDLSDAYISLYAFNSQVNRENRKRYTEIKMMIPMDKTTKSIDLHIKIVKNLQLKSEKWFSFMLKYKES